MQLQGSHTFPVLPAALWPMLMDASILTAVMPGCQNLEPIAENQYQGKLTIPYGPMSGSYTGNLSVSHLVENEGFAFTFTAQSQTGTIGGNGRLHLQPQDDHTILTYEGEAKVGGQLASHATPLLETTARSLIRQSLENLGQYLQPGKSPILLPTTPTVQIGPSATSINMLGGQQTTILIITALTTITLFALFYFFKRKPNKNS